jgi:ATP dependent DNA ligase domain
MLLTRDRSIPIAFVAFDVLSLDGKNVMQEPYLKRPELLECLNLAGSHWCTAPSFEDGQALWSVVERDELEGIVAKPLWNRTARRMCRSNAISPSSGSSGTGGRRPWRRELRIGSRSASMGGRIYRRARTVQTSVLSTRVKIPD